MKSLKTVLIYIIILFTIQNIYAQDTYNYYSFEDVYSIAEEGDYIWIGTDGGLIKINKITDYMLIYNIDNSSLPSNSIRCIDIDKFGNKWIVTDKGLVKFNGSEWIVYNDLTSGYCIAIDKDNIKWIGTVEGVLKYDDSNWIQYTETGQHVYNIVIDESGTKWFVSYWGGVTKFDGTNWTNYNELNSGLPQNEVRDIVVDPNGNIYICTESQGLIEFDGSNWTISNTSNSGIPTNDIQSIDISHSGDIWIGSKVGLIKYDGNSWFTFSDINSPLPVNFAPWLSWFNDVKVDEEDVKWVATRFGLYRYNNLKWNKVTPGIPAGEVTCLTIDKLGKKWFGTWDYTGFGSYVTPGLVEFDGDSWNTNYFSNPFMTPDNWLTCISIDKFNQQWIGTQSGKLIKFNGSDFEVYDVKNYIEQSENSRVNDIIIDNLGNKWIATSSEIYSLIKFDDITYEWDNWTGFVTQELHYTVSEVKCIAIDKDFTKWIGFRNALYSFDDTTWTYHFSEDITCIEIDSSENIWVGSKSGLAKYDGLNWTHFHTDNSEIPSLPVNCISFDKLGNKWMGLGDDRLINYCLVMFDDTDWIVYNNENSRLPDNHINFIEIDEFGNKWIGTALGLSVFNENGVVSVKESTTLSSLEQYFSLSQNYPNPFNPSTTIKYSIPSYVIAASETKQSNEITSVILFPRNENVNVILKVYDILGREVATLVNQKQKPGNYQIEFDGKDLTTGIYFYRIQTDNYVKTKKMMLIK